MLGDAQVHVLCFNYIDVLVFFFDLSFLVQLCMLCFIQPYIHTSIRNHMCYGLWSSSTNVCWDVVMRFNNFFFGKGACNKRQSLISKGTFKHCPGEAKTQVMLRKQSSPTPCHLSGANQTKINETIANILKKTNYRGPLLAVL